MKMAVLINLVCLVSQFKLMGVQIYRAFICILLLTTTITFIPDSRTNAADTAEICNKVRLTSKSNIRAAEKLVKDKEPKICSYYVALTLSKGSSTYSQNRALYWVNHAYKFADRRRFPSLTADILYLRILLDAAVGNVKADLRLLKFLNKERYSDILKRKFEQQLPLLHSYLIDPLSDSCPENELSSSFLQDLSNLTSQIRGICKDTDAINSSLNRGVKSSAEAISLLTAFQKLSEVSTAIRAKYPITSTRQLDYTREEFAQKERFAKRTFSVIKQKLASWKTYHQIMDGIKLQDQSIDQILVLEKALVVSRKSLENKDPRGAFRRQQDLKTVATVMRSVSEGKLPPPSKRVIGQWLKNPAVIRSIDLQQALRSLQLYHSCRQSRNAIQKGDPCIQFFVHVSDKETLNKPNNYKTIRALQRKVEARIKQRVVNYLKSEDRNSESWALLTSDYYRWVQIEMGSEAAASFRSCVERSEDGCLQSPKPATVSAKVAERPAEETQVVKLDKQKSEQRTSEAAPLDYASNSEGIYWESRKQSWSGDNKIELDTKTALKYATDSVLNSSDRRNLFSAYSQPWLMTKDDAQSIIKNIAFLSILGDGLSEYILLEANARLISGEPSRARRLFKTWLKKEPLDHPDRRLAFEALINSMRLSKASGPIGTR